MYRRVKTVFPFVPEASLLPSHPPPPPPSPRPASLDSSSLRASFTRSATPVSQLNPGVDFRNRRAGGTLGMRERALSPVG